MAPPLSAGAAGRWGEVSPAWATPVTITLCVATFAGLLWLTRGFDFYYDEWDFVLGAPHWTLGDYFFPHNEHWSTVPTIVYKAIISVQGARSYTPFMGALLAVHAGIAYLLYLLIRRRQGALLGLVAAATILFLGRGYENILWAFQIGFLGSILFGLGAWLLLDAAAAGLLRQAAAAVLLLLAVMSSGVGLFMVAAIGVELLLDRSRRRRLAALAPAVVAYLAWFLLIGRAHAGVHRSPFSPGALRQLVTFVPFGIGAALVGLFGLSLKYSEIGLAALAGLLVAAWGPPRPLPPPRVVAALAGLLAEFALIGLVRAQFGDQEAGSARYVYIAAVFLLIVITDAAGALPWRGLWRVGLVVLAGLALIWSGFHLVTAARAKADLFARQQAELATLWAIRDAPDLNRQAVVEPETMPQVSVRAYLDDRRLLGSTAPVVAFDGLQTLPASAVDRELVQVLTFALVSTATPGPTGGWVGVDPVLGYMDVTGREGQRVNAVPRPGSALCLGGGRRATAGPAHLRGRCASRRGVAADPATHRPRPRVACPRVSAALRRRSRLRGRLTQNHPAPPCPPQSSPASRSWRMRPTVSHIAPCSVTGCWGSAAARPGSPAIR